MAAWAVLEADALTLFRRCTRWLPFVADREFECDRFDDDMREKLPDTGREPECSCFGNQYAGLLSSEKWMSTLDVLDAISEDGVNWTL